MKLLLDTCTFIWLCAEPSRLSASAKKALQDSKNTLLLSDVSTMEISFKTISGKLKLPSPPSIWIEDQIDTWGFDTIPLSRATMYRSGELPLLHKDPFDRLLIASAIESRATVITPDEEFRNYPVGVLW